ncbi:bifunctional pyr operon transcriptional regulator/uracil phosphoribosyltransferase PyrR [bacterium]|nr:bifunctional pyr operon transcriptional regulator/uracil phosphoribosyltransferase PyrR [bacterium]
MTQILNKESFEEAIKKLAEKIREEQTDLNNIAFIGIHTRGVHLSNRLAKIFKNSGVNVQQGILDINLYRDDLSQSSDKPILKETKITFDVSGKIIYLIDDVLYTGRTVRAAMDAVFDLGRPQALHLVVMAKRSGRELPIDTNLCAITIDTKQDDSVAVRFEETDNVDEISLFGKGEQI